MEFNKQNEIKDNARKTASSFLLAGLILGAVLAVLYSYPMLNHIISTAAAQNIPAKKCLLSQRVIAFWEKQVILQVYGYLK
jgi:hypothetical protein